MSDRKQIISVGFRGQNIGDLAYRQVFPTAFPSVDFLFNKVEGNYDTGLLAGGNIVFSDFVKQIENVPNKYAISISLNSSSDIEALKDYKQIIVRDLSSQELLKKHNIQSIYAPDITLLLRSNLKNGRKLIEKYFKGADLYKKIVCISLNSHLLHSPEHNRPFRDEANFQKFCYDFADILDNTSSSFILLPFSTDPHFDDRIVAGNVSRFCKYYKKNVVVYDKLSVKQTLDVVSASDGLVGSRLHSLIFAYLSGVPYLDVQHDSKTTGFIESVNSGFSTPYNNFNKLECKKLLDNILENKETLSNNINKSLKEQRTILNDVIKNVDFNR